MVHGFSYCFIWTHDMQNLHSLKFKNGVTDSNFRQKKKNDFGILSGKTGPKSLKNIFFWKRLKPAQIPHKKTVFKLPIISIITANWLL